MSFYSDYEKYKNDQYIYSDYKKYKNDQYIKSDCGKQQMLFNMLHDLGSKNDLVFAIERLLNYRFILGIMWGLVIGLMGMFVVALST